MQTLYLALTPNAMTVSHDTTPSALFEIAMTTDYVFDHNTQLVVQVTDTKETAPTEDPLNHLVFHLTFRDKVDQSVITQLMGRLYIGGGAEALEQKYAHDFGYIVNKLDFYGALDQDDDFFDVVESRYQVEKAGEIQNGLTHLAVLNTLSSYRVKEKVLAVPKTVVRQSPTPNDVYLNLLKLNPYPNYLIMADISSLPMIEAMTLVMDKLNIHAFLDVGQMTDYKLVVALVNSLGLKDQRFRILWNPNVSRPVASSSVLARKKWRPCVGDYLAKHLLRNALRDHNNIPPLHIPVGGYHFPVGFSGMRQLQNVHLDEQAQNALAQAGVITVLSERFENETRFIYGDVLTQRNSKTSALRLANAAEIETFTANMIVSIIKKHLLKNMDGFLDDAYFECNRFLDNCVSAGLLKPSEQLNGRYYVLSIDPRADKPFEAVDVKLARRPEGAVRQAFFETTINK